MTDTRDEGAAWVLSRPACIQATMRRFPPRCMVRATRPLACPPPGAIEEVVSYFENGNVSVESKGIDFRAICEPDWLEVVGFHEKWTADYVAWLLDGTSVRAR